jgi:hypothetical protein
MHPTLLSTATVAAGLVFAFLSASASADIRFATRETVNGRTSATPTFWFGDNKRARVEGAEVTVTRIDLGKVYVINRDNKTFSSKALAPAPAILPLSVVDMKRSETLGKWRCKLYQVTGAAARGKTIRLWVTRDLKIDRAQFAVLMTQYAGESGAEWLRAYQQIDGVPVMQEVSETRGNITQVMRSKVTAADVMDAPHDMYLPPRGYRKVP